MGGKEPGLSLWFLSHVYPPCLLPPRAPHTQALRLGREAPKAVVGNTPSPAPLFVIFQYLGCREGAEKAGLGVCLLAGVGREGLSSPCKLGPAALVQRLRKQERFLCGAGRLTLGPKCEKKSRTPKTGRQLAFLEAG